MQCQCSARGPSTSDRDHHSRDKDWMVPHPSPRPATTYPSGDGIRDVYAAAAPSSVEVISSLLIRRRAELRRIVRGHSRTVAQASGLTSLRLMRREGPDQTASGGRRIGQKRGPPSGTRS